MLLNCMSRSHQSSLWVPPKAGVPHTLKNTAELFRRSSQWPQWNALGQQEIGIRIFLLSLYHRPEIGSEANYINFLKISFPTQKERGFPGSTSGKEPACQCRRHKRRVWSLVPEDPQEESMATYSSILAWRILWTKKSGGPLSMGWQSQACLKQLSLHTRTQNKKTYSFYFIISCPDLKFSQFSFILPVYIIFPKFWYLNFIFVNSSSVVPVFDFHIRQICNLTMVKSWKR